MTWIPRIYKKPFIRLSGQATRPWQRCFRCRNRLKQGFRYARIIDCGETILRPKDVARFEHLSAKNRELRSGDLGWRKVCLLCARWYPPHWTVEKPPTMITVAGYSRFQPYKEQTCQTLEEAKQVGEAWWRLGYHSVEIHRPNRRVLRLTVHPKPARGPARRENRQTKWEV